MKSALLKNLCTIVCIVTAMLLGTTIAKAQVSCVDPQFPAPQEILANVPEASGYNLAYHLPIPTVNQTWTSQADIPYAVNNSVALSSTPFLRVAYYMKLESIYLGVQWVWVSMDAFSNDITQISIPTGTTFFQQQVANMNILHYSGNSSTGVTGNIEFWSNCYNPDNSIAIPGASDFNYDFGDAPTPGENCYGSFQIHDYSNAETIIAYNGWAFPGATYEDLGVNNFPSNHTDWSFADNAGLYDVKELYVFVSGGGAFQLTCNPVSVSLDANGTASITSDMVTNAVIGNCGITDVTISQSDFTCANLGANSIDITVTRNGVVSTCTTLVTIIDNTNPTVIATGTMLILGCNPSASEIESALGSASASDICGVANITDISTSTAILYNGMYSQTRTWIAEDASGNTGTTFRTISWPSDQAAPEIRATGTTLILQCNPSASEIEAALGTATVTDDCGTPSMDVSTGQVILINGINSQSRTWLADDGNGNTASASRTVTWPDDVIAPVITPTGTTLNLGCNPSASEIEAALGTASVVDDCGTASITDVTTSSVNVSNGVSSQTRTWVAEDVSANTNSVSRTITWTNACVVDLPNLYTLEVSCEEYNNGDGSSIDYVCYTIKSSRIKSVSPGGFYYYANVAAPAVLGPGGSFYIDVVQTKACATFKFYGVQGNQVRAYDNNCKKQINGSEISDGQGRVKITGASPGRQYTISVRYETNSQVGVSVGNNPPTCLNTFVTKVTTSGAFGSGTVIAGSQATLQARPNCSNNSNRTSIIREEFEIELLEVEASPNPSSGYFTLYIKGNSENVGNVNVRDVSGKIVGRGLNQQVNQPFRLGENWKPGTYFVEVILGKERKTIKLIKL